MTMSYASLPLTMAEGIDEPLVPCLASQRLEKGEDVQLLLTRNLIDLRACLLDGGNKFLQRLIVADGRESRIGANLPDCGLTYACTSRSGHTKRIMASIPHLERTLDYPDVRLYAL